MRRRKPSSRRRGSVIIAVWWILIILSALVLILGQRMRIEMMVTANHVAQTQAEAIEKGAEQLVFSLVDGAAGDAVAVTSYFSNMSPTCQVGDGYFWIIRPYQGDSEQQDFGIVDEASKINLNGCQASATVVTATTFANILAYLPGMESWDPDIPTAIAAWRGNGLVMPFANTSFNPQIGVAPPVLSATAQTYEQMYMTLPDPFHNKGYGFESVEEVLQLLQAYTDVDPQQFLFGYDTNHNGVIDAAELEGGGMSTQINASQDNAQGIFPFLTVYTHEPSLVNNQNLANLSNGIDTIQFDINTATGKTGLTTLMQSILPARVAGVQRIFAAAAGGGGGARGGGAAGGGGGTAPTFTGMMQFFTQSGMLPEDFAQIAPYITVGGTTGPITTTLNDGSAQFKSSLGLINVNTAPYEVLAALCQGIGGQLTVDDANTLIAAREMNDDLTTLAWVAGAIGTTKANALSPYITGRSYQYSADIVALSADGRVFKRVRLVVDASQSPPIIVYRKDLTSLGWPLDPAIRESIRAGQGLPAGYEVSKGGM